MALLEIAHGNLTLAISLAAGVLAICVARHLRLPAIVLLLAAGAGLGPDGLHWIDPDDLGGGLFGLVDFAVAVILFEGGLGLQASRLRREESAIRWLVTVGALVTFLGAALLVKAFMEWPWSQSLLFGSLVVVTGPTVVSPLLRDLRLRPRIKTVLEAEGVLIDPIGALLAVLVLQISLAPGTGTIFGEGRELFLRLGFGLVAGLVGGFFLGGLLRFRNLVPRGYENIFALATVVLLFFVCDSFKSHSGILAVTVAGVVVGNMKIKVDRDLRHFKDQLTMLLVGLLFILLSATVSLADVKSLGWQGGAVVAGLILFVRPLNVAICTRQSGLSGRERSFIGWIAPRGVVAAAIASLTAQAMETSGMSGGSELRALVFLTIAGTVVLAGFTARPVASLLKLRLPTRDRVAILGANGLGLALGTELRDGGVPVVFLDSDPHQCRRAEELEFPVVYGDALEERSMQRAQSELVGTAIGMTTNDALNSSFVGQARQTFHVPRGFVALSWLDSGELPEHVERTEAKLLFDGSHDVARWDVRSRHGELEVDYLLFEPLPEVTDEPEDLDHDPAAGFNGHGPGPVVESENGKDAKSGKSGKSGKDAKAERETGTIRIGDTTNTGERYAILTVRRGDRIVPMSADLRPKKGDVAAVAVYVPERERALEQLRESGWEPQS